MAFTALPNLYAAALINHLANTATTPSAPPPGSSPPVTVPDATSSLPPAGGSAYYGAGGYGPNDAAAVAAGFMPGSVPNAGQSDLFGNIFNPVNNAFWTGGYVDPKSLPGKSTVNAQLWGGPTSDSPPAWLQKIVTDALSLSGDAKTARIRHIMSSLTDPAQGANQHDLGYAERMFGISQ